MPLLSEIPVILIFGPTGVGKTRLLYSRIFKKTEIINADSMQVYRGMDVGTAKPDKELLNRLTHHLINIKHPNQQFSTVEFVNLADSLVKIIYNKDKLPIICGGTGFYFKNFIYGLPKTPKPDEKIRQKLKKELEELGFENMYNKLLEIDPISAGRIKKNDSYRLLRALEVYYSSGKPLSEYKIPTIQRKDYNFFVIGLNRERAELYSLINSRVDLMFEQGLRLEFENLRRQGLNKDSPGMKGIGYKEFFLAEEENLSEIELKELIKRNSRKYAKRQITWFRQLNNINWFHPDNTEEIANAIKNFVEPYFPSFG